jgi:hypothetical protein
LHANCFAIGLVYIACNSSCICSNKIRNILGFVNNALGFGVN